MFWVPWADIAAENQKKKVRWRSKPNLSNACSASYHVKPSNTWGSIGRKWGQLLNEPTSTEAFTAPQSAAAKDIKKMWIQKMQKNQPQQKKEKQSSSSFGFLQPKHDLIEAGDCIPELWATNGSVDQGNHSTLVGVVAWHLRKWRKPPPKLGSKFRCVEFPTLILIKNRFAMETSNISTDLKINHGEEWAILASHHQPENVQTNNSNRCAQRPAKCHVSQFSALSQGTFAAAIATGATNPDRTIQAFLFVALAEEKFCKPPMIGTYAMMMLSLK